MLINSCWAYISRGMGVRKVSNSKNNLQGHSRALAMVSFDSHIRFTVSLTTMSLSCSVTDFELISLIHQNLKRSCDCRKTDVWFIGCESLGYCIHRGIKLHNVSDFPIFTPKNIPKRGVNSHFQAYRSKY